jgi:hypothetical protein
VAVLPLACRAHSASAARYTDTGLLTATPRARLDGRSPRGSEMLKWKWVALALVTSTLSANAEESSKEKFLNNYGRMLAVEARCPSWKINEQKVVEILNFFKIANADIEPGGHDWPAIERSIHSNQRAFAGIGPKMMCVKANAMYGPKGAVSPGLMEPK